LFTCRDKIDMNVKNDYAKWTKMGGGETSLLNLSPADDAHTSTHTAEF